MASSAGKWREEQILIICPGSRTTMAQLGCNELTPPTHRIPTRMFRDENLWAPYHRTKRVKVVDGVEEEEWVEDLDEDEGAVYPIEGGRIVNMEALLAFLDHVHSLLTTTYHNTPIMLMASPQWTRPDCETIARYIFENTRTPSLCIIHSGIATQYGLRWPNMTVVDIGYEKVDVTAIHDGRVVSHMDLGTASQDREISGGEVFTRSLLKLLGDKGFDYNMAEQLKKSTICEVLPYAGTADDLMELPVEGAVAALSAGAVADVHATADATKAAEMVVDETDAPNGVAEEDGVLDVASIVTSGQTKEFLAKKEKEKIKAAKKAKGEKEAEAAANKAARLPNSKRTHNTFSYEEIVQEEVPVVKEGAEKTADANGATTEAPPAPTAESSGADAVSADGPNPVQGQDELPAAQPETKSEEKPEEKSGEQPEAKPEEKSGEQPEAKPEEKPEEKPEDNPKDKPEDKPAEETTEAAAATAAGDETLERRPKRIRRDVEVGLERFQFAERAQIDRIVYAIYRTIQAIDDMYMRPACWENLVFVGNGARLRGLRENILQTLHARHLVSPSTATMFTSELPSNLGTPTGTGSQTPTGSFSGAPHQLPSSGVNPLLQAATTASLANNANTAAATPQAGSEAGGPVHGHHFHSQTPTSIKTAALPTYLSEWSKNGFEEAMFLGAQVAARLAFCIHSNMDAQSIEAQRLMSLSRVDYNELGPKGIRTHSMLG